MTEQLRTAKEKKCHQEDYLQRLGLRLTVRIIVPGFLSPSGYMFSVPRTVATVCLSVDYLHSLKLLGLRRGA